MGEGAPRIGSICSGYGGLDMAVQAVLGAELAWVADNDPGPAAILAHRFPGVPNLGDITAVDWGQVGKIDILAGGTPCQDVSQAGQRAGLRHGNRSGVWHEMVKAIAELRPSLVVIENVQGLLTARGDEPGDEHLAAEARRDHLARLLRGARALQAAARSRGDGESASRCAAITARVMGAHKRAVARCLWHERRLVRAVGTVLGSLARLGFDAEWGVFSAADAGACHLRKRVFVVAWPAADPAGGGGMPRRLAAAVPGGDDGAAEDTDGAAGGERRVSAPGQAKGRRARADAGRRGGAPAADPDMGRRGPFERDLRPGEPDAPRGAAADAGRDGRERRPQGGAVEAHQAGEGSWPAPAGCRPAAAVDWGRYRLPIARWEAVSGRPAPPPTSPGRTGERLNPRFAEWMMGLPDGWVTDVPGLSREAQLKAIGGGVVWQQGAMALRLLLARAGTKTVKALRERESNAA